MKVVMSINQIRTQCETLERLKARFNDVYQLAFANGGDQNNRLIPG